jgi:hypothetical protein
MNSGNWPTLVLAPVLVLVRSPVLLLLLLLLVLSPLLVVVVVVVVLRLSISE